MLVNAQQQLFRDPNRSVAYAAFTLSCCLVEIFGATRIIDRADYLASVVRIRRPLRLLDLRGEGAMCAGTVAAVTKTPDRGISQQWSRYFYDYPQVYGAVDGLLSASAYNDEDVITLYERAVDALYYRPNDVLPLDDPASRFQPDGFHAPDAQHRRLIDVVAKAFSSREPAVRERNRSSPRCEPGEPGAVV